MIVEAKLDVKNLYVYISKNAMKFSNSNNQPEENDIALNSLNKYTFDYNRLLKFINTSESFRMEKCKLLIEAKTKEAVSRDPYDC